MTEERGPYTTGPGTDEEQRRLQQIIDERADQYIAGQVTELVAHDSEAVQVARVMLAEAEQLAAEKQAIVRDKLALVAMQRAIDLVALATTDGIVKAAGGEKGLGSNETAQKRAISISLAENEALNQMYAEARKASAEIDLRVAHVEGCQDVQAARRWLVRALTQDGGLA